jgi:sugar O-acyltransferase (sialic acid O-acetyltransferase NeuD family)
MKQITSIGYTESHFLMISEILFSLNLSPYFYIFDNQNRFNLDCNLMLYNYELIDNLSNVNNYTFCLGKPSGKKWLSENFDLDVNKFINLIHKSVTISLFTELGIGIRIEPNTCIAPKTNISDFVHINRGCLIGHHCNIGKYSTLNPGVKVGGNVDIGESVEIGIGTTILNNIHIGNNSIIGANSLVTKDVPENVIVYGSPAKIIRHNE